MSRPSPAQTTASDFATWGAVHLRVRDVDRSERFWQEVVGLRRLRDDRGVVRLGVDDAELVALHPGASRVGAAGHTGLYHLAIHLASEAEFARTLARLSEIGYPNSPTDHVLLWATYLNDPDGITVELSFETPDRFRSYASNRGRPGAIDSDGRLRAPNGPLNLAEVFAHLADNDLESALRPETRIGHLHLYVGHLQPAIRFYEALGFRLGITHPIGMAELNARGSFPHRLAANIWNGVGATPLPEDAAGMLHADLSLREPGDRTSLLDSLRRAGGSIEELSGELFIRDPSGNRIHLT